MSTGFTPDCIPIQVTRNPSKSYIGLKSCVESISLIIFDNGGFTSGSKDESLFPSLYTSGDQYNVDNENLSNLTFVNSLAAQPRTSDPLFPSLFEPSVNNITLKTKANSSALDIFSSSKDDHVEKVDHQRSSIFGTFDDKNTK